MWMTKEEKRKTKTHFLYDFSIYFIFFLLLVFPILMTW